MSRNGDPALQPLAAADGEPAFAELWQAQVLAMADILVRQGLFGAGAWSEALGTALKEAEIGGKPDTQETYYGCALEALEKLIAQHSDINYAAMTGKREDWKRAYLKTPHGQPVELLDK